MLMDCQRGVWLESLPALVLADVVVVTVLHALGTPHLADVEGHRLGVLGQVGSDIALTYA